jgi:hypothetical protein
MRGKKPRLETVKDTANVAAIPGVNDPHGIGESEICFGKTGSWI